AAAAAAASVLPKNSRRVVTGTMIGTGVFSLLEAKASLVRASVSVRSRRRSSSRGSEGLQSRRGGGGGSPAATAAALAVRKPPSARRALEISHDRELARMLLATHALQGEHRCVSCRARE